MLSVMTWIETQFAHRKGWLNQQECHFQTQAYFCSVVVKKIRTFTVPNVRSLESFCRLYLYTVWQKVSYHRLRSSASPVLTATHHSYGSLAWLSDFFPAHPWRSDPSTDLHANWLKQREFTQGWYFCSKNRYFSYPWSQWPLKGQNFANFWA